MSGNVTAQVVDWIPKAVVFDFDGVIVESADVKTEAFLKVFEEHPEHHPAILAYHLEHQGISRYVKFEWIYRELLVREVDDGELKRLGSVFSNLVMTRIQTCPFVPGTLELLGQLRTRALCFVASGTPQHELLSLIRDRGLETYFTGVWGSPATKTAILNTIMREHGLSPTEVLFVGDGVSDYTAAHECGVRFVARETPEMRLRWRELGVPSVKDMYGLAERLAFDGILAAAQQPVQQRALDS